MRYARGLTVITLLGCAAVLAQTGNPYNGNWSATWQGTRGLLQHANRADVVILDTGGTFQNQRSSTRNPCVGKKAPIVVKTASADELIFVVEFSTVLRGCEDSEVRLKRVDDRTLKGFRDGDKEITLIRE